MADINIKIDKMMCKGCELCVSVCPRKILSLDTETNRAGYYPAKVNDIGSCIGCASCAKMCPEIAIYIEKLDEGRQ